MQYDYIDMLEKYKHLEKRTDSYYDKSMKYGTKKKYKIKLSPSDLYNKNEYRSYVHDAAKEMAFHYVLMLRYLVVPYRHGWLIGGSMQVMENEETLMRNLKHYTNERTNMNVVLAFGYINAFLLVIATVALIVSGHELLSLVSAGSFLYLSYYVIFAQHRNLKYNKEEISKIHMKRLHV